MNRIVLGIVAVTIAIMIALVMFARQQFDFTITFGDTNGISVGAPVFYQGTQIGEVRKISPGQPASLDVRIGRDYERRLHRGLSFFVERESMLGHGRRVVAYDCGSSTPVSPIERGDVVAGNESTMTWLACKAADRAGPLAGAAAALIGSLATSTETGRAIADAVKQQAEAARKMGDAHWETFRREKLPALEQEARRYKEQLEREGKVEDAKRFWEQFTAWVKEMTLH